MKRRNFLAAGLSMTGENWWEVPGAPIRETRYRVPNV